MRWIEDNRFGQVAPKLRMVSGLQNLRLTPEEGFVMSRVDGFSSIEEICLVTGLPRQQTLDTLAKLHDAGLLEVAGAPAPAAAEPEDAAPRGEPLSTAEPRDSETKAAPLDEAVLPTAIPEFQLDADCELSEERQRAIHELYFRLDDMDFYELLGLSVGCDAKEVQRAYRKISLKFHPDRFFGKRLGSAKARLEAIFRHVSNVADYLTDDAQRAAFEADLASAPPRETSPTADRPPAEPEDSASAAAPTAPAAADRPGDTGERRALTREDRLRRLGGILGMSSQELRAVTRGKKPAPQRPSETRLPELSETRRERITQAARTGIHAALGPALQRRQKAKLHYDEGIKAMQAGNFASAASNLKLALTFEPKNQEYRDKEAIASVKARETSAVSYAKRASMEDSVGRVDEAARLYAMAAERHATLDHLTRAAKSLLRIGELKRAVEYAIKARDLHPESVIARVTLGQAYLAADMPKSASREVDHALKIDSNNAAAKALLKEIRKAE